MWLIKESDKSVDHVNLSQLIVFSLEASLIILLSCRFVIFILYLPQI